MKLISRFILWLFGWKTAGEVPPLKKFVAILAPHTSGLDFLFGMCAKFIFGIHLTFLGKEEVFRFPFGFIFRWLGGVPVDRSSSHNVVDYAVKLFNENENFILALSPEGTRAYVPKWKTGFYYIALNAKVPIVLTYLDFEKKRVGIGPTFYPTGDIDKDIEAIKDFYRPIKGKYPELGVR
ncbi:MAG: Acyltransferase [Bacteroidota bacterium]|nr:Acyltransferase [Bacteroidota bacterium]